MRDGIIHAADRLVHRANSDVYGRTLFRMAVSCKEVHRIRWLPGQEAQPETFI